MKFEPQKFYIGMIEFFSVILPGVLFTYVLMSEYNRLTGQSYQVETSEQGLIFLFISYVAGHFIFMMGSTIDNIDQYLRNWTFQSQLRRVAEGEQPVARIKRWLSSYILRDRDEAMYRVLPIKQHYLARVGGQNAVNAFQWSKAWLTEKNPQALAEVERFEADSKFFRSFIVVLFLIACWKTYFPDPAIQLTAMILALLSFYRFEIQRIKATSSAYWYVLTFVANEPTGYQAPKVDSDGSNREVGLVIKQARENHKGREEEVTRILLVRAKNNPDQWVLPKGHIENGEKPAVTAVREVYEETGVWARPLNFSQVKEIKTPKETYKARFHLMEYIEQEKSPEERETGWFTKREALAELEFEESREFIEAAFEILKDSGS